MLKCVVLGSSNVGKSSLLERYTKNSFRPERRVTLGADFASKVIEVGEERVRLVIWDTAGQERFHHGTIGGAFYRAPTAPCWSTTLLISALSQVELWRRELPARRRAGGGRSCAWATRWIYCPTRDQDEKAAAPRRAHGVGLFASACDGTALPWPWRRRRARAGEQKAAAALGVTSCHPCRSDDLHAREADHRIVVNTLFTKYTNRLLHVGAWSPTSVDC